MRITLAAILGARGTLSPGEAARVGIGVASALAARGHPHGAIRPETILIEDDGALALTASAGAGEDIRDIGVVLYECLAGVAPSQPVAPLPPDVPIGLSRIVMRALEPDPDDRFASPLEMAAALDTLAIGSPVALPPGADEDADRTMAGGVAAAQPPPIAREQPPEPAQPDARERGRAARFVEIAFGVAALAGLIAGGYGLVRSRAPAGPHRAYAFPIEPADRVTYEAGHPSYPATDLFAPPGLNVVAVTDGVIEDVSARDRWDPDVDDPETRGGVFVALVGDDGLRYYYSHLQGLAPGIVARERVRAGQILGYTGLSGKLREARPHMHFGISRLTSPRTWRVRRGEIDPYPALRAWERGADVKPAA